MLHGTVSSSLSLSSRVLGDEEMLGLMAAEACETMLEREKCTSGCSSEVRRTGKRIRACLCPGSRNHAVRCVMGVNRGYDVGVAGVALF